MGAYDGVSATTPTVNTGSGGGGGLYNGAFYEASAGASGLVVIRYTDTFADLTVGAGLTYTSSTSGGYKTYTFTAGSGPVSW